jgi:hypothetical protein
MAQNSHAATDAQDDDLPTAETVEGFAEDADLSAWTDDALDALDDRLNDLLNGDPCEFPTDAALSAAFRLSQQVTEERSRRDPRTDPPHHAPFDTTERFPAPVYSVRVERRGDGVLARFTLNESDLPGDRDFSEWTVRESSGIADAVLAYYGVDGVRLLGVAVGTTLPVVGADDTIPGAWGRVDRYALEHGGAALDDEGDDDPEVRTDGGDDEDDDGDEWDPEPADPRDGETPEEDSHAARNARMLREAPRDLDREDSDEATQEEVREAVEAVEESPDVQTDAGRDVDEDENGSLDEGAIREQLAGAEDEIREFSENYEPVEGEPGAYRPVEDDEGDA